jgi:hypothetical protein
LHPLFPFSEILPLQPQNWENWSELYRITRWETSTIRIDGSNLWCGTKIGHYWGSEKVRPQHPRRYW